MVSIKACSKERLVDHLLDGVPSSAKSSVLSAIVAETGELDNGNFDGCPISFPERVQVAILDSML